MQRLESLGLQQCGLSDLSAPQLGRLVGEAPALRRLDLSYNNLGAKAVGAIALALPQVGLRGSDQDRRPENDILFDKLCRHHTLQVCSDVARPCLWRGRLVLVGGCTQGCRPARKPGRPGSGNPVLQTPIKHLFSNLNLSR